LVAGGGSGCGGGGDEDKYVILLVLNYSYQLNISTVGSTSLLTFQLFKLFTL
jgi:hypothetical protein